jgi:hypothetical protein
MQKAARYAGRLFGGVSQAADRCRVRMPCRYSIPGPACSMKRLRCLLRRAVADRGEHVGAEYPDVPIIGFPKGAGSATTTIGQDRRDGARPRLDRAAVAGATPAASGAVQGNLDPMRAGCRRLKRWMRVSTRFSKRSGWPACLQSRPRHHAGRRRLSMSSAWLRACGERGCDDRRRKQSGSGVAMRRAAVASCRLRALTALLFWLAPDDLYLWIKALHVIAVIAWMAGMLYLPRLFVYHADVPDGVRSNRRRSR